MNPTRQLPDVGDRAGAWGVATAPALVLTMGEGFGRDVFQA